MSLLLGARATVAEHNRVAQRLGKEEHRLRLIKIVCALLLAVLFWFSVPYAFPVQLDTDPVAAAADEAQAYSGNLDRQISMPIIFVLAAVMLWRLPKRGQLQGRLLMVAVMYVGWAMVSFAWSDEPSITAKRLVVFGIDAFFAFTVARVFSVLEMALWGFTATGTVALIALYVDCIKEARWAPFDPDYRFMGVMTANYQAMNLLVCVLCGLTLLQRRPQWKMWLLPSITLAMGLMYLTRGRVGSIVCVLLIAIVALKYLRTRVQPQARAMVLIAAAMLVIPAAILVLGRNGTGVLQTAFMMGRTDTQNTSNLSNRAPLWTELMESVETRPWLGFGYDGFWTPDRVEKISADQGWTVPHAHNTYLDQTLSLGVIGAGLYIAMLFGALFVAWGRYRRNPTETDLLPALLLTWMALTSLAESIPLDPYLPSMLGYACLVKMCMREGSEAESDVWLGPEQLIGGLTPQGMEASPEEVQAALGLGQKDFVRAELAERY